MKESVAQSIAPVPTYAVLSIDAWRDREGGWQWNQWYSAGAFPRYLIDKGPRRILSWFRENDMLAATSAGKCAIEDDGHNVVIINRNTREPIFAIDYGSVDT